MEVYTWCPWWWGGDAREKQLERQRVAWPMGPKRAKRLKTTSPFLFESWQISLLAYWMCKVVLKISELACLQPNWFHCSKKCVSSYKSCTIASTRCHCRMNPKSTYLLHMKSGHDIDEDYVGHETYNRQKKMSSDCRRIAYFHGWLLWQEFSTYTRALCLYRLLTDLLRHRRAGRIAGCGRSGGCATSPAKSARLEEETGDWC